MNQNSLIMLGIAAVGGYLLYNWYEGQPTSSTGTTAAPTSGLTAKLTLSGATGIITIAGPPNTPVTAAGPGNPAVIGTTDSTGTLVTPSFPLVGVAYTSTFSIPSGASTTVNVPAQNPASYVPTGPPPIPAPTSGPAPVPMQPLMTSCPAGQMLTSWGTCQPTIPNPPFQCPKNAICAPGPALNGLSANRIPMQFIHRGSYGQF